MKRSKLDTAETRRTIVATASHLFVRSGVASTGVGDIMGAAGLTVGGFYRHFESKEQLLAEATRDAFDDLLGPLETIATDCEPAAAIRKIVAGYLGQARGAEPAVTCPLASLGTELKRGAPNVRDLTVAGHQRFVRLLTAPLKALGVEGAAAATMASGIVSTLVGAVMLAQLPGDPLLARGVLRGARKVIDTQLAALAFDRGPSAR